MNPTFADRAAMERARYWMQASASAEVWNEADGRVVFGMLVMTDGLEGEADHAHLANQSAVGVTLTIEWNLQLTIREFNAAEYEAEEDRLSEIAVKRDEAEDASAEDQEGEE